MGWQGRVVDVGDSVDQTALSQLLISSVGLILLMQVVFRFGWFCVVLCFRESWSWEEPQLSSSISLFYKTGYRSWEVLSDLSCILSH